MESKDIRKEPSSAEILNRWGVGPGFETPTLSLDNSLKITPPTNPKGAPKDERLDRRLLVRNASRSTADETSGKRFADSLSATTTSAITPLKGINLKKRSPF